MKKSSLQLMAKITAVLSFLGSVFVVINLAVGIVVASQGGSLGEVAAAALPLNLIIGMIGIATFVLGIILMVQFSRFGKPITTGVLLVIAGVFSWLITIVSLILWIIAGILLLLIKFDAGKSENAIIN